MGSLTMRIEVERWPYLAPFRIAGYSRDVSEIVVVSLEKDGCVGRGEAVGVRYRRENAASLCNELESLRAKIERGLTRESLQSLLPPGGSRNALDCALWDLDAKLTGQPAWQLAGLEKPRPLMTTFTCGAEPPEVVAAAARAFEGARAIKLKLTGEAVDAERVRAAREARPDVWMCVDANQGLTRERLDRLMPTLIEARITLIEQPFPAGQESLLDGLRSPIPIAADESVQSLADLRSLVGRFSMINIKLDKCGGLTEGLAMARAARELGMEVMVGNMVGTSLAMAPAYLLGQLCNVVDLDGPTFLKSDRPHAVVYADGFITCPEELWGSPIR